MKILLYITTFRQLLEFKYFSIFFNSLKSLNKICDVFIYCNNANISDDILTYFKSFNIKNKFIFVTSKNDGYRMGGVEALSTGIDMNIFSTYDYVIHLHPDVFIVDDQHTINILEENLDNDICFFITQTVNNEKFASFDFFIFKPRLLSGNIFKDDMYTWQDCPEIYLYNKLIQHNIKFIHIPRFSDNNYLPRRIAEYSKIWHEHDLDSVKNYLIKNNLYKEDISSASGGINSISSFNELVTMNLREFKYINIKYTDEFIFWNNYLNLRNFTLDKVDMENKIVCYSNINYINTYLLVIYIQSESQINNLNRLLFSLYLYSSDLPDILIYCQNIQLETKTILGLFNYKIIDDDFNKIDFIKLKRGTKRKGIMTVNNNYVFRGDLKELFSSISNDGNCVLINNYNETNIDNIDSFKNLINSFKDNASIESDSLVGKTYIWNHSIDNTNTESRIKFSEDNYLYTPWGTGNYRLISNKMLIAKWGYNSPEHFIIFNNKADIIYSYRPDIDLFSSAIRVF